MLSKRNISKKTSIFLIATLKENVVTIGASHRLKLLRLTRGYVKRHITRARDNFDTDQGFHSRKGKATYQKLIADLDTDNPHGTYCYHCRNIAMIDDMVISHARCSLARVYHEECGRLINVWP